MFSDALASVPSFVQIGSSSRDSFRVNTPIADKLPEAKRSTSAVLSFAKPTHGVNQTICDALASILENIRVAQVLSSLLHVERVMCG